MRARPFVSLSVLVVGLIAVSSLFNVGASRTTASSHREAPNIASDPLADNTDLYAFVSPDQPDTVTIIANYYPGEDPAGGPNFYKFGDDVRYAINIDNDGDADADITYRFRFSTDVRDPNTFLYNTGPVESLDSENLNVRQFYLIQRITDGGEETIAEGLQTPPVNVGPTSMPDYEALANAAIFDVAGGIKVFAGQRDDPFWVDLGGIFDLLTIRKPPGNDGGGVDDLKGLNVQTIALQIPIDQLTSSGDVPTATDDPGAVIGIWSTALRRTTTVINTDGSRTGEGGFVQVSRLGAPLVNEVVVPLGTKDLFNASQPADDAQFLDGVQNPQLPGLLNAIYGIEVPEGPRDDLVAVFLTGVPGLNQPLDVTPSEQLRLNVAIPPADEENPLGVIGGDNAGFPNGRRLRDEVVDIELRVVAGVLNPDFNIEPNNQLGDGVPVNDVPFLDVFPYVAPPHQGFEHEHHAPTGDGAAPPPGGAEATAAPEETAAPEARTLTVELAELNDSGIDGEAVLTETAEGITVDLTANGATGGHPAHIHEGTCDTLDPNPEYPLTDIGEDGTSATDVDVTLDELTEAPHAINVHLSAEQIGTYVMCGTIEG